MNFEQWDEELKKRLKKAQEAQAKLPAILAGDALRFIDDNFRQQAWEGEPWKGITRPDGTILVHTAKLKNSFNFDTAPGEARIYTNVPYAAVHNEGFSGSVNVPSHKRSKYKSTGKGKMKKTSSGMVKAHSKKMEIDQRQFAPTESSPSPTLEKQIANTIQQYFNHILKPE
jgi:phage gpG-like protein